MNIDQGQYKNQLPKVRSIVFHPISRFNNLVFNFASFFFHFKGTNLPNWAWDIDYQTDSQLFKGGNGTIYVARLTANQAEKYPSPLVAVKKFKSKRIFVHELTILTKLQSTSFCVEVNFL